MIQITAQMRVLVAIEAVDGRKGIDSLARLCQEKLAEDPFSGCVFVFRSRGGTAIRLLTYDGQGYWLAQKRLSKGRFVWWPEATGPTKPLEAYEAQLLMAAGDLSRVRAAPMWRRVGVLKQMPHENGLPPLRSKKKRFILRSMVEFRYRGRQISQEDVLYIRALVERHPNESRRTLSTRLCEAWQWRQANGALRDLVCRGLLLMLERAGQITLPPVSYVRHNPLARRTRPEPARIDVTPMEARLCNLQPLEFEPVRRTGKEPLFNSLMEEHHYLGYEQPVGEHLKYLVSAQGRPVACLAWSSAPRHLGSRDRYIGWSAEARRRNIRFLAYNTRFLILPWIRVEHLASHILGRMAARISGDWQRMYGHPIYFLETFVDPERFRGTCYRAANWVLLGKTTGRGKQSNSYVPNRSIKEVLGYPLTKRFRELLGEVG
jgi:hypothetical protein